MKSKSLMVLSLMLFSACVVWAQETGAAVAGVGMTLGWDAIFLTLGGIGLTALVKKFLPDELEVKWIPVVAHVWSLAGTFLWKAIVHQVSWNSAGLIAAQAILQAIIASGLLTHGSYAKSIATGEKTATLGDARA